MTVLHNSPNYCAVRSNCFLSGIAVFYSHSPTTHFCHFKTSEMTYWFLLWSERFPCNRCDIWHYASNQHLWLLLLLVCHSSLLIAPLHSCLFLASISLLLVRKIRFFGGDSLWLGSEIITHPCTHFRSERQVSTKHTHFPQIHPVTMETLHEQLECSAFVSVCLA